jgi:putative Ca2+/H+ antiporter (TMEM165/GDT1 family)
MLQAITAGFSLIAISELGDKTFFIAMILAMRHPKEWVFAGVMAALAGMTVISVLMGQVLALLPRIYIHIAAIALFLVFGIKLLYDGWRMPATATQAEVAAAKSAVDEADSHLLNQRSVWSIFLEALSLTFVAEWGDRTQIATVTLAATNDAVGVTLGAVLGHALCALIAIIGGGFIAGRISERVITLTGGTLFIIFGLVSWWQGV